MADVLVPDTRSPLASQLAERLEADGHLVHRCVADDAADRCVELTDGRCPLDTAPVDIVVSVDATTRGVQPADGATCAARRRIPLVLVGGGGGHPLAPWVAATPPAEGSVESVAEVLARPLTRHTAEAERAMLSELRRQGAASGEAAVAVYRRPGRLLVDLTHVPSMSHTQAERLATHVAQAVRSYDRWAPKLDITIHEAAPA